MDEKCTVYRTVDLIGKKWSLLIILSIFRGGRVSKRYSEIKRSLPGISPKMLSERLKELDEEDIIRKEMDHSEIPIKTFYSLTESGADLVHIIQDIKKWGLRWKFKSKACEASFCGECEL